MHPGAHGLPTIGPYRVLGSSGAGGMAQAAGVERCLGPWAADVHPCVP